MSVSPSFTIVMPTFQRRDVVGDAVRALCGVRYDGEFDLIVVVDGSTDGTADTLRRIETSFPMRVIEQPNSGAARARNTGAADAQGDILLFLDDDMMAAPDMLEQHAGSHAGGADAVLGHIPLDPESPKSFLAAGVARWAERRAQRLAAGEPLTLFDLLTGQLSVRRALFERLGGFDERFTANGQFGDEDLDFGVRLMECARVEFNMRAISHQRYVVTPRQCMKQWADAGRADVEFARKHPARAAELYSLHGGDRPLHRLLLRPLAAVPLFPSLVGGTALWLSERDERLPMGLRRLVPLLYSAARDLIYWASVREGTKALGTR